MCLLVEQRWTASCEWSFVSGGIISIMGVVWYRIVSCTFSFLSKYFKALPVIIFCLPNPKQKTWTCGCTDHISSPYRKTCWKKSYRKLERLIDVVFQWRIIIRILLCRLWLVKIKIYALLVNSSFGLSCIKTCILLVLKDCKVVFPDTLLEVFNSWFHKMLVSFCEHLMIPLNSYISFSFFFSWSFCICLSRN